MILSIGMIGNTLYVRSLDTQMQAEPSERMLEVEALAQTKVPPLLSDIDVTVLRVGMEVPLILDFKYLPHHLPRQREIAVAVYEKGNVVLRSRQRNA